MRERFICERMWRIDRHRICSRDRPVLHGMAPEPRRAPSGHAAGVAALSSRFVASTTALIPFASMSDATGALTVPGLAAFTAAMLSLTIVTAFASFAALFWSFVFVGSL